MRSKSALAVAGLGAAGLLAVSAPAHARFVELAPGPEGLDSSPYAFFPALPRGNHDTLYAFSDPTGHGFEIFLGFELPQDLLGPEEQVAQAFLTLFHAIDTFGEDPVDPEPGTLECREALAAWSEDTLTWGSRPAYGAPVDVVDGIDALGAVACDVTGLVQDWAEGERPNHGFALTSPTTRILGFYSFEAAVDPALKTTLFIDIQPVPEPGAGMGALTTAAALAGLARRRRVHRSGA
jgi:hypothetical protein